MHMIMMTKMSLKWKMWINLNGILRMFLFIDFIDLTILYFFSKLFCLFSFYRKCLYRYILQILFFVYFFVFVISLFTGFSVYSIFFLDLVLFYRICFVFYLYFRICYIFTDFLFVNSIDTND